MTPIAGYSNNHQLAAGRPSAAKTGTAQLGDTGQNKDAWMIGSTPQLATAIWIGDTAGNPLTDATRGGSMYGSGAPSDIWQRFMDQALADTEIEQFESSDGVAIQGSGSGGGGDWTGGGAGEGDAGAGDGGGDGGGGDTGGDTGGGNDAPPAAPGGRGNDDFGQMIEDFLNNF